MIPRTWLRTPLGACAALLAVLSANPASAQTAQSLDQSWASADKHYFYRTTQGSRLIPYDLFVKLERSGSTERFASSTNLTRYGFLYEQPVNADNPDNLPIGIVKDARSNYADAVGLTCAACHTRDITYQGTRWRIDGAQSYSDTERFLSDLEAALAQTNSDAAKFERLRAALNQPAATVRAKLTAALDKLVLENASNRVRGTTAPTNPGPGRLDAFAHIKNRTSNYVWPTNSAQTANTIDATAPVSFPFLWDAPYLDFVQWPGNVANWGPGSLARNTGEVLGVFAETTASLDFFGNLQVTSTADVNRLVELENRVLKLRSPAWPSNLPAPNGLMAALGKPLFEQYCGSCHGPLERTEARRMVPTFSLGADVVKTDVTMADNNVYDRALAGYTNRDDPTLLVNPLDNIGAVAKPILINELWRSFDLNASHKQPVAPPTRNVTLGPYELDAHTYKARPLNGIWATGPYLHNGSVRTLYQLMLPGPSRDSTFCVGSLEFDAQNVGMANDCSNGAYLFDTSKKGNSRLGHEYGTPSDTRFPALNDLQRRAVVEYMKTL